MNGFVDAGDYFDFLVVAGSTQDPQGASTPCFWKVNLNGDATITQLPLPQEFDNGEANGASIAGVPGGGVDPHIFIAGHVSTEPDPRGVIWLVDELGEITIQIIDDLHSEPWSAVEATDVTVPNWDAQAANVGCVGNALLNQEGGGAELHAFVGVPPIAAKLTKVTVPRGTLLGGGLEELGLWDERDLLIRYDQFAPQYMQANITAKTLVPDHSSMDVIIISNSTEPSGTGKVRLRNFTMSRWDTVHTWATGLTDSVEIVEDLSTADYVDANGLIKMQLRYSVPLLFGAGTFDTFIDLVEVRVR